MPASNCKFDTPWCGHSNNISNTTVSNFSGQACTSSDGKLGQNLPFITTSGYYGYVSVYPNDVCAMETSDVPECTESNVGMLTRINTPSPGNSNAQLIYGCNEKQYAPQRKRNSSDETSQDVKRQRRESPFVATAGYEVSLRQPSYNIDYHYPRCTMAHYITSNRMSYGL